MDEKNTNWKAAKRANSIAWTPNESEVDAACTVAAPTPGPARKCSRCSGTGFIAFYSHVDGGKCMACGGAGKVGTVNKKDKAAHAAAWKVAYSAIARRNIEAAAADVKAMNVPKGESIVAGLRIEWIRFG